MHTTLLYKAELLVGISLAQAGVEVRLCDLRIAHWCQLKQSQGSGRTLVAESEPSGADIVLAPEQLELSAVWCEPLNDAVHFVGLTRCFPAVSYGLTKRSW